MPRPQSGPRLWFDKKRCSYTIVDGKKTTRTGCGIDDLEEAKSALEAYLAASHVLVRGSDPFIADCLIAYRKEHLTGLASEKSVTRDLLRLTEWWGAKHVSEITQPNCRKYIAHRTAPGITRRELGFLNAAVMHWHRNYGPIAVMPSIVKPKAGAARERWLTRSEAARFLMAARKLRPTTRRRIVRLFIIGWYTGTRHNAICNTRWDMIDLDAKIMLRRLPGVAETRKRTPPVKMGARLTAHLKRWKHLDGPDAQFVLEHGGRQVQDIGETWVKVREAAGLGPDVIPHTLRHSRATHMMRQAVNPWEAAQALGMSLAMLEKRYGHHHPSWQSGAAEAK